MEFLLEGWWAFIIVHDAAMPDFRLWPRESRPFIFHNAGRHINSHNRCPRIPMPNHALECASRCVAIKSTPRTGVSTPSYSVHSGCTTARGMLQRHRPHYGAHSAACPSWILLNSTVSYLSFKRFNPLASLNVRSSHWMRAILLDIFFDQCLLLSLQSTTLVSWNHLAIFDWNMMSDLEALTFEREVRYRSDFNTSKLI